MATATAPAAYDDGSSTESEYYFDPAEEAEEEAAYAWAHEHDAPVKQEPLHQLNPEPIAANTATCTEQFSRVYRPPPEASEEIALPQGSEWSHGAVATEGGDAVERALAMASRFEREMHKPQREEAMTADTMNSNEQSASPVKSPVRKEQQEAKAVIRTLKKSREVKVKQKVVSLRSVKAAAPTAVVTKPVVEGLMRPVVREPTELDRELSVPRPSSWKATAGQGPNTPQPTASPNHSKSSNVKQSEKRKTPAAKHPKLPIRTEPEKLDSDHWTEQNGTLPSRVKRRSRSRSTYRNVHNKSPSSRRERSPSSRREAGERSKSPVRYHSKRSRSRSPRRHVEERRKRSRSPYRPTTAASPRHYSYYDSQRRPGHSHERSQSRSPSRPSRSYHSTHIRFRSRSRSRSRSCSHDHSRYDSRPRHDHYDDNGRIHTHHTSEKRDLDSCRPVHHEVGSSSRQVTNRLRSDDYNSLRSERPTHEEKHLPTQRGKRGSSVARLDGGGANISRLQVSDPLRSRRPASVQVVRSVVNTSADITTKRSSRDPRIRPRVEASTASHDRARMTVSAAPQEAKSIPKKRGYVYHDAFERRVFKLKLQEADLNEKMAATSLTASEMWFFESRRKGIAADRAMLEAQNLERFEKLYASTQVSSSELNRYQGDRDFAYRVVRFKRKQASLQEQKGLFITSETRDELWRRLDEERDELIAENSVMFHKVMMGPLQGRAKQGHCADFLGGRPNKRLASSMAPTNGFYTSASAVNSRVVVGAALQLQEMDVHRNPTDPLRVRPNKTPWFMTD